jgi:hypothetical protein
MRLLDVRGDCVPTDENQPASVQLCDFAKAVPVRCRSRPILRDTIVVDYRMSALW